MDFSVIITTPIWAQGGPSVYSANLVRGLLAQGIPAHVVVTGYDHPDWPAHPLPSDILVDKLPVAEQASWEVRRRSLIRYLEERAPCIYLPNVDFLCSCVSPKLSHQIAIVGGIHSDHSEHYQHFGALGKYWNAAVAGSKVIEEKAATLFPALSHRIVRIPYGVSIPTQMPRRASAPHAPLKIVYCGRLAQQPKRVLDLPKIVEALLARQVPVQLTVTGGGPQESELREASKHLVEQGIIRFTGILPDEQIPGILAQNDVVVLTSEFEGQPLALIEAMGHGCVPVVTDIPSGIPELVQHGVNGYCVPVGAIKAFAECLAVLHHNPKRRCDMSMKAYVTVDQGQYRIEDMMRRYIDLFQQVWRELEGGGYRRPRGRIVPPPFLRAPLRERWKDWLPAPVRRMGRYAKRSLLQLRSAASTPRRSQPDQ